MSDVRKIVVVAGAGASRNLGMAGRPMPLMSDWATSLQVALESMEAGAADAIGLEADLRGDIFEKRLGDFLAFQSALPLMRALGRVGGPTPWNTHGGFEEWWNLATTRSQRIVESIRSNLFSSFGYTEFDDDLAEKAYAQLRSLLAQDSESTYFTFATTNYDAAIETAWARLGFRVLDGFRRPAPVASEILDPQGLALEAATSDSLVPVLHLHGAVGWYRDESSGTIRKIPGDMGYNPTLGTPALLLPDSTKTIDSLRGAEQLWIEFRALLAQATHVLVLGHSLHDKHLVEVLKEEERNLAVATLSDHPSGVTDAEIRDADALVSAFLPKAFAIPWEFGPNPSVNRSRLDRWLAA